MRAVIHLHDYDPDPEDIVHDQHQVVNPPVAADSRAVIDGVYVEWYPGGGNIHITDDRTQQVADASDRSVLVDMESGVIHRVPNATLAAVYPADEGGA